MKFEFGPVLFCEEISVGDKKLFRRDLCHQLESTDSRQKPITVRLLVASSRVMSILLSFWSSVGYATKMQCLSLDLKFLL